MKGYKTMAALSLVVSRVANTGDILYPEGGSTRAPVVFTGPT